MVLWEDHQDCGTPDPTNQKEDYTNYHSHQIGKHYNRHQRNTEYDNISCRGILQKCVYSILEKSKRSRWISRLIQTTRVKPRRDQYFNRSITSKIKTIIKILPTKTRPGLDGITAEFCQTFKKIHNLYVFCFMCLSTMCMPDATLELELQINVDHHINWMLEMKPCLLQEQSS